MISLPLAWYWQISGLVALLLKGLYEYLYAAGYLPWAVHTVRWREFGGWEITTINRTHHAVILAENSFCHRWLTVLNLHTRQGKRFRAIFLADNLSPAQALLLRRRWLCAKTA